VIRTQYNAVWGTGAKIKGKTRARKENRECKDACGDKKINKNTKKKGTTKLVTGRAVNAEVDCSE